jgi:quinol monooxygenase YgiN
MKKILIAGVIRVPVEKIAALRPHIQSYVAACRAEDGCETFSFAEDMAEPGLIRVFEIWRDPAALERHKATPHVAAWRKLWPDYGVHGRSLTRFEVSDTQAF